MKLFNHVQIKVADLKRSREFYDSVMTVIGSKVVLDLGNVVGYGTDVHDMFEIRQYDEKSQMSSHVHIAFNAHSQCEVDEFYLKALEVGGICNGKPGFRPHYEDGYYAAFIYDPDGHNIEVVHSCGARNPIL